MIEASTPSASEVVRRAPSATQKIEEVGGSSTMPSGRTSSASSAPASLASRGRQHVAAVGERLDPVEDDRRLVGDRLQLDRLVVVGDRLGGGDAAAAAGDDQRASGLRRPGLGEQRLDLGAQRHAVELEAQGGGGAFEPGDVVGQREGAARVEADHLEGAVAAVEAVVLEADRRLRGRP